MDEYEYRQIPVMASLITAGMIGRTSDKDIPVRAVNLAESILKEALKRDKERREAPVQAK